MSLSQVQLLAAQSVQKVASGQNLDKVLTLLMSDSVLPPEERAALKDLAYGTQRYLGSLTFFLRALVSQKLSSDDVENLLLVALYQLSYTKTPTHVVVSEAVNVAATLVHGQFKGLVNGVLRNFLRQREALLKSALSCDEAKYNHPRWLIERIKKDYPKYWHNILSVNQMHPPMTLRFNQRRTNLEAYLALLQEHKIEAKAIGGSALRLTKPVAVKNLPGFLAGMVSVQDYGAQQAAQLLKPKDGEKILDACAAPGGKTGHLLELADCQVLAVDIDQIRLNKVEENLSRLGLAAKVQCADAAKLSEWYNGDAFDAILADVPCSASGVIRRHPDIKWLRQTKDAVKVAQQQVSLLDALWLALKPEGRMLLATCSVFFEENQQQTARFLSRHPDAILSYEENLLPCDQNDGFYYALIQKN